VRGEERGGGSNMKNTTHIYIYKRGLFTSRVCMCVKRPEGRRRRGGRRRRLSFSKSSQPATSKGTRQPMFLQA
jgi:hypothetical protein